MLKNNNINKTGYTIPKGYLNTLEKNILNKINSVDNLSDSSKTGYKTPDDYFINLEERIIKEIRTKNKFKKLLSNKKIYYLSGIAAMLILSIFIITQENRKNYSFDDISNYEIESYLNAETIDNTNNLLVNILNESTEFDQLYFYDIKNETLIEYIESEIEIDNYEF